ncbi:MAG: hypothetical protein V1913_18180 [Fibrobacterota bacterium]
MKKMSLIKKLTALLMLPAALFAISDNTVVVNYMKPANTSSINITVDPLLLTVALQNELFKTGKFKVVERSTVFNTRQLQDLSMSAGYSAYDAMLLGLETRTPLIVLSRIRFMGDQVWIQIGLFDSEMEQLIEEVTGFYPNSKKAIMEQALPELVKKLVPFDNGTYTETKPALTVAPVIFQKESVQEKNDGTNDRSTGTSIKSRPGFYKWAILGLVTISAALLIDRVANAPGTQAAVNPHTEVVVQW